MNQVKLAGIVVAVVAAFILLGDTLYVVTEYQQAVILRFGKFEKAVQKPGIHAKLPIVQQITFYDKRLLDHDVSPTEIVTKDKRTLLIDSFSKWKIVDPEKFYTRMRTETNAKGRIRDIIFSELWQEFGQHTLEEIVTINRKVFMESVTQRSNEKAENLEMGIKILDVRIKRADLPETNKNAVFKRMREERKRIATQFRSEGEEEANKIRAKADKEKVIMLADAYQKEQTIRGEGDATSIKIYADAYGEDSEFYDFIRSLEAYKTALKKDNTLVLSNDSEFLKYLGTSRP